MTQRIARPRLVNAQAKGQITIPGGIRELLGIDTGTPLSISLVGDHLELAPLRQGKVFLRSYTEEDITLFLVEDKLDQETARPVRELIDRGEL